MKTLRVKILLAVVAASVLGQHSFSYAQSDYKQREALAAESIGSELNRIRKAIQTNKWTFTVGYTEALDIPLARLTGLKPPEDLLERIAKAGRAEKAKTVVPSPTYDPTAPSFDLRSVGKVTPIRNQHACGSCWAFATLGAYESSYAILNPATVDASEQSLLSCSGEGTCSGGWWAFQYLRDTGASTEGEYPYVASDTACNNSIPAPLRATDWGYVSDTVAIPSIAKTKEALCTHGALAVAVNATPAFQAYTGGVFNEDSSGPVNHGVTLIGWDDARQAWLIKNSWGTSWGDSCGYGSERGYMWINYNANRIGYAAAWVDARTVSDADASITSSTAEADCCETIATSGATTTQPSGGEQSLELLQGSSDEVGQIRCGFGRISPDASPGWNTLTITGLPSGTRCISVWMTEWASGNQPHAGGAFFTTSSVQLYDNGTKCRVRFHSNWGSHLPAAAQILYR